MYNSFLYIDIENFEAQSTSLIYCEIIWKRIVRT